MKAFFAMPEWNKRLWFISNVYKKQRPFKILYFALVGLKSWWRPCIRGAKSGQKSKVYKVFGKETRKSKLSKLPKTSDFLSINCITDVVKSLSTVQTKVQPFACNKMSMSIDVRILKNRAIKLVGNCSWLVITSHEQKNRPTFLPTHMGACAVIPDAPI